MTLTPGVNLGPYRIVEQIGRGGMASVYKAYQPALARHVAIKVLPAFFTEDPGFRERFQQEAIAVAKLRHPNILQVFDYGEQDGITYLVSEFIDGGTLADQVGSPLPLDYTVKILTPIANALDYAHARGVLHRDVKPSNILLSRDSTPILSDFGLAKMIGSQPRLTVSGATVGTPEYMAPEQGEGAVIGPAADQYALGVVAYEMLTGRVPFTAETPLAVLISHMHKPLPLPRSINPALSESVEFTLLKALAKVPGDRFPVLGQFVGALGGSVPAPQRVPPASDAARTRRAPSALAMIAAVAVLAVIGGVAFALTRPSPSPGASGALTASATVAATTTSGTLTTAPSRTSPPIGSVPSAPAAGPRTFPPGTFGISGRVTSAATGEPLNTVTVFAWPSGSFCCANFISTVTDTAGRYLLPLQSGSYRVSFEPRGIAYAAQFWPGRPSEADTDDITVSSATVGNIDAALIRGYAVSGTVKSVRTGAGVAAALVHVNLNGSHVGAASTDALGRYTLHLANGSYNIEVYAPGPCCFGNPSDQRAVIVSDADVSSLDASVP